MNNKRTKAITRVSVIGILTNIVLVAFKATIGLISGSISIVMDALNNLSDVVSSVITMAGTIYAGKKPDKNHPYGHGKIEHFSSLGIGCLIIAAGVMAFIESAQKILNPNQIEVTAPLLIIVTASIFTKVLLSCYVQKQGKKYKSDALIASGKDAMFDALTAAATLSSSILILCFNINIDGWIGALISILIFRSGVLITLESANDMIGHRVDQKLIDKIKHCIGKYPEVLGSYDLMLHQYGPSVTIGSVHIEVDDDMTAKQIHALTRQITEEVEKKCGVVLTIGIYAANTDERECKKIKQEIEKITKEYKTILSSHGFYVDNEKMNVSVDLVFSFEEEHQEEIKQEILQRLEDKYEQYSFSIIIDQDSEE